MSRKWELCGGCPYCGGKTEWYPNLVKYLPKGGVLEVGQYIYLACGEKSGIIESELEQVD
jgi:hypothetical protein